MSVLSVHRRIQGGGGAKQGDQSPPPFFRLAPFFSGPHIAPPPQFWLFSALHITRDTCELWLTVIVPLKYW